MSLRSRFFRLLVLFCLTLWLCVTLSPAQAQLSPVTPAVTAEQQIQQGRRSYRDGQYSEAVQILQQSAQSAETASRAIALSNLALAHLKLGQYPEAEDAVAQAAAIVKTLAANDYTRRLQAQVFSTQAQIQMSKAQLESALAALAQAEVAYQAIADTPGLIRTWLNQAQILRVQGRYRQSLSQLRRAGDALDNLPDSALKAAGLRQLGNLQRLVETVEASLPVLEESLRVAEGIGSATEVSATLLSLGNAKAAQQTWAIAIDHYQQAAIAAPSVSPRLQAQINHLQILLEQPNFDGYRGETVLSLSAKIQAQLPELPLSRSSVLMQASLGQSLIDAKASPWSELKIAQLLAKTSTQAQDLEDGRGQSYALGYLGRLYQKKQQWSDAAATTQQALTLAQGISADSIAYQWQWQLGQILRQQGHTQAAIAAYQQAISTLQSLRSSLVAVNPEVRYSFRAGVEPIYRELVDLLLQPLAGEASEQKNLLDARDAIESLQVAELVNFFRADCLVTNPVQIDQVDAQAAVIYPIILPDRLEVVVRLPGQEALQHQSVAVSQTKIEETLDALRTAIADYSGVPFLPETVSSPEVSEASGESETAADPRSITVVPNSSDESTPDTAKIDYLSQSQQVYQWLIAPIAEALEASNTQVLVFVLDGALRNVPMAVLHDGQQYLVEKYAIALTPGLQLLDPQPLAQRQVTALVAGLSEANQPGYSALPAVAQEVEAIKAQVPSAVLLNQQFNNAEFEQALSDSNFPVVHLATHGEFSSDPEETYILTWDGRILANELSSLLQFSELSRNSTIELLILSACETAAGDERAALGLAGIAVRSGARSTLATLWQVNDQGTALLMSHFYQQLSASTATKAEILRQAQLELIHSDRYQHPYFWAPFVLVGNWL